LHGQTVPERLKLEQVDVPHPVMLTSPQTVFAGVTPGSIASVTATVTINNLRTEPVSVRIDGIVSGQLGLNAGADLTDLTAAVCTSPDTLTVSGRTGTLPSRFEADDLTLIFGVL